MDLLAFNTQKRSKTAENTIKSEVLPTFLFFLTLSVEQLLPKIKVKI